jgi:hypothetical protein
VIVTGGATSKAMRFRKASKAIIIMNDRLGAVAAGFQLADCLPQVENLPPQPPSVGLESFPIPLTGSTRDRFD